MNLALNGTKAAVAEWLPKIISMVNGDGLEVRPGVIIYPPDRLELDLDVQGNMLVVKLANAVLAKIDAHALCLHVASTEKIVGGTVTESGATLDMPDIPVFVGKPFLEFKP